MGMRADTKADIYEQLASLQAAGIAPLRAIESLRDRPPGREAGRVLGRWAANLRSGASLGGALPVETGKFEPFESAILSAGEESGRLEPLFRELARYWRRVSETRRCVAAGLVYPLLILNVAIIAGNVPVAIGHGAPVFGIRTASALAFLYALVWCGWELAGTPAAGPLLERLPVVGRALRSWRLFRFSLCLRLQVEAGVRILTALPRAFAAAGGPALAARGDDAVRRLSAGEPLGDVLAPLLHAPDRIRSILATGVESGRIPDTLRLLETEAAAAWEDAMNLLQTWLPRIVYFAAIAYAAWQIVAMAGSIANVYRDAASFE